MLFLALAVHVDVEYTGQLQYTCADPEGGDRGSGPPLEFENFT